MNDSLKSALTPFLILLAAPLAACSATPEPAPTDAPSVTPTHTATRALTPTRSATPSATFTPTPLTPTATPFPSATPTPSAVPTSAPILPLTFKSIHMVDSRIGWAMTDLGSEEATHLLRTSTGGRTWQDVSPQPMDFMDVYALDGRNAWLSASGAAWRTQDGGRSWMLMNVFGEQPGFGFVDGQHGWRLNGMYWGLSFVQFDIVSFATTDDGGMTWQETNPPPGGGLALMAYPSASQAWGVRGWFAKSFRGVPNLEIPFVVQVTFDRGRSWISHTMPLPSHGSRVQKPYGSSFLGGVGNCEFVSPVYSSVSVWKLALTCEQRSWLYTSTTNGKTWIISDMPAGLDADIQFVDASHGWLLIGNPHEDPEGHLYWTNDGGGSWTLLKRTGWADARFSLVDAQTGWAIACTGATCDQAWVEQAFIKTTDGGRTWRVIRPKLIP